MRDVELRDEEPDAGILRKCVERIVLFAWIVTAIGAAATIVAEHYAR